MKQAKFLLTSMALLLCSITISAHDFEIDGIYYNIQYSTYYVQVTNKGKNYGGYAGSVTIPTRVTYNGVTYEVTRIGYEAFRGCSSLTSIEIPNSVTSIGEGAFQDCSSLTSIEIPNSVTSIGREAFAGCSSLTSIEIPNSVTSIGGCVFNTCPSLTEIKVAPDNPVYDSRDNCNAVIKTKSNTLIAGCASTIIPSSVTSIIYHAFYGCSSLTSIEIPNSVTRIGEQAFYGCSSLTSIEIPNSLTSIGHTAFYGCSNLKIVINNSNLNIKKGSTSFGYIACYADRVLSGENVDGFFFDGEYGDYILTGYWGNETNLVLPDNYMEQSYRIGNYAFNNCSSLTSIEIPNSVTSIGNYAFSGCSNLDYFSFGKSVKSIGQKAFSGCVNLKKLISYAEVPPTCDTYALDDINKRECTLQIPENTLSAYQSANQWKDFYFIEDVLSEIGGVTIDENKDTRVDVYSINGQLIKRNADAKQLSKELPTGIYIINGKKVYVR